MESRLLHQAGGLRTYVLLLDKGEEAVTSIASFAADNHLAGAAVRAAGGCREVRLGYYEPVLSRYRHSHFSGQHEVLALIGDIVDNGGRSELHARAVLGRKDSTTLGGHLERLIVFPKLEAVLTETPAHLHRAVDPETGMAFIAPGEM
ncbi:PPC domain-containing DNA-binding protein [Streptomyces sulphureus]|uniref:PPC domain-containing DNA-binding protein n=1 Tax=Streptomyces sulphureus TaxID=47758 RepID=UPI000379EC56|nr:DUF296 domain-containing protein [Streptomyces sulphureus]